MDPRSSVLAWRIPWAEEPGGHGVAKSRTRLSDRVTHLESGQALLGPD